MDWITIDSDNSLQGVFLTDPGIKASIKWTLSVNDLWKKKNTQTKQNDQCRIWLASRM